MGIISFYTENKLPPEDEEFVVNLLTELRKDDYKIRDLNPDSYCLNVSELDTFVLVQNLCIELGIKNPFFIYMLYGKNLVTPVDCAFFHFSGDVPSSLSTVCAMSGIPFINLGNKEVQTMFKEHMDNPVKFFKENLGSLGYKPKGLCLSAEFCPF